MHDGPRRVTDARRSTHGRKRRVTIYLDGDPWRTTTVGVARALGVTVGDDIDPVLFDNDARDLEVTEARERALKLLGYRERSVAELLRRLEDDGYPDDIAAAVVGELERTGLVDDERFAGLLARSLVTIRGYGRARARRQLSRYGIAESVLESALDEVAPSQAEPERALESATRLARPSDTVDRLAARLVRRGFAPGLAFTAARRALVNVTDDVDTAGLD